MAEVVVRVQWRGGFTDVSDGGTGTVRVVPYNAGQDVTTEDAATTIGTAVLDTLSPRETVTAEVGDSSFWPEVGDAVSVVGFSGSATTQRLVGRRVNTDRNGKAIFVPTLGSPAEEFLERQKLSIEKMATGLAGGRSAGVAPASSLATGTPSGPMSTVMVPPWSFSPPAEGPGNEWIADAAVVLTKVEVIATTAPPSDDIVVYINLDGSMATFITLTEDTTRRSRLGSLVLGAGQRLSCSIHDVGANTEADLEDVRLTVQFAGAPADLRVTK